MIPIPPPREDYVRKPDPALVERVMTFVEQSLHLRLNALESLVEKNKASLSGAKDDHRKLTEEVSRMTNSTQSKSITEDIRMLFAIARNDKSDLAARAGKITSRVPVMNTYKEEKCRSPLVSTRARTPPSFISTTASTKKFPTNKVPIGSGSKSPIPAGCTTSRLGLVSNTNKQKTLNSKSPLAQERLNQGSKGAVLYQGRATGGTPTGKKSADRKSVLLGIRASPYATKVAAESKAKPKIHSTANETKSPSKPTTPSRMSPDQQNKFTAPGCYSVLTRNMTPPSARGINSRQQSPARATPSQSKREIQGDPIDIAYVQPRSLTTIPNLVPGSPFADIDDRIIPRRPYNIQPEVMPVFEDNHPSNMNTPNNVSSFMELLNYNSSDEESARNPDIRKSNQKTPIATRTLSNTRIKSYPEQIPAESKSRDRSPATDTRIDISHDIIQSALATLQSHLTEERDKMAQSSPGIKYLKYTASPKLGPGEFNTSTINLRAFEKVDERLISHPMCCFPGLPFIKPTKHSSRLAVSDYPERLSFSILPIELPCLDLLETNVPVSHFSDFAIVNSVREVFAKSSSSSSPLIMLEHSRKVMDEEMESPTYPRGVTLGTPPIRPQPSLRKREVKEARSSTPDIVSSILEDYL